MNNNPILSIITINLNNALGLHKTIRSVLNQTFNQFEYLIIDGGSTDNSTNIIQSVSHKLSYWVSERDSGRYSAMNKGIGNAKGEFIAFLNSGDKYFSPYSLETVYNYIKIKSNIKLFFFDYLYQSGSKQILVSSNDVTNKFVIYHKGFGHPSTFYHFSLFKIYGLFNESYQISADRAFYMRVLVKNKEAFSYFPFAVSIFKEGGISTDKNYVKIVQKEDKIIIDANYTRFEKKIVKSPFFNEVIKIKYLRMLLFLMLKWRLNKV